MPALYYMKYHAKRQHAKEKVELAKKKLQVTTEAVKKHGMSLLEQSNVGWRCHHEYEKHLEEGARTCRDLQQKVYMAQLECDFICFHFPEEPPHAGPNFFGSLPSALVHHVIAPMLEQKELCALIGTAKAYRSLVSCYRPLWTFCFANLYEGMGRLLQDIPDPAKWLVDAGWPRMQRFAEGGFKQKERVSAVMQVACWVYPRWLEDGKPAMLSITNASAVAARVLFDFAMARKVPVPIMLHEITLWKKNSNA